MPGESGRFHSAGSCLFKRFFSAYHDHKRREGDDDEDLLLRLTGPENKKGCCTPGHLGFGSWEREEETHLKINKSLHST